MSLQESLARLRPVWLQRVSGLARGAGVRENFAVQAERFYEMLEQATLSGDPSWLDGILVAWANSAIEGGTQSSPQAVSLLLRQMLEITLDGARQTLPAEEALSLLTAVTPFFAYALDRAARLDMESQVEQANRQRNEIQAQMEQLDRSKSTFISVAAHELKTPLTLIEGYTSMMRDLAARSENNGVDELIRGVHSGITRLRAIIEDMIDVSLIDNKMLGLNLQPTWLAHLFGLLRADLGEAVQARRQTLEVRPFPGSDQMIFADPERLYQALRNVLTNAIKYTPDGGRIVIDGRLLPGFVEVTVSDTGIGISPEHQAVIFEKFAQVGEAALHSSGKTKFKGGGPGLGLPIARGIIEAHGGTIWVESEGYDEERCPGSTFHILLPLRTDAADPRLAKLFGGRDEKKDPG